MVLLDISMPLAPGMPVFPGDPAFAVEPVRRIGRGDPYDLSRIALGTHGGTHVDPPSHFVAGGATIDQVDLGALNGPCTVVEIPPHVKRIDAASLPSLPTGVERVLFRTSNSARWATSLRFFPDYAALEADAAALLRKRGVRLVGVDALSVENDPTLRFPVHHELLSHGVLVLEGLLLGPAKAGPAVLHCLPLKVAAGDGGPARAALAYA
jgi:arylformamidase